MKETEKEVRHYLPMCYFQYDEGGLDPKTCFFLFETHGRKVLRLFKCNDPITCQRVIWGKQLTDMTIDMWCKDILSENREGWKLLGRRELDETLKDMPDWVTKNVNNRTKQS
jgi:hypothetical protein